MAKNSLIDSIRVLSACSEDWNAMTGNEKVRFCSHCDLNVNNISEMTRKEALKIVRKSEGKICVRYIEHPKTKAPVFADKLYQIGRRSRIAAGVLGASLAASTVAYAQGGAVSAKVFENQTEATQSNQIKNSKKEGGTASISGTVTDPAGAVIPGSTVKLINLKTETHQIVTTNDYGTYQINNIISGTYTLEISSADFKTVKINNIVLNNNDAISKNFQLEVNTEIMVAGGAMFIDYEQPLLRAVSDEEIDEVKNILAKGTNVNVKDKNYDDITALFVAVEDGNIKMVETLLNFGADVNARSGSKRTPLMGLDEDATPELVNLLLQYDPKINAIDEEGNNVLHFLADEENPAIIELLIKAGADINVQNKEGQTPLMIAAYYENVKTVKALLSSGANVNLRDEENETALSIAQGEEGKEAEEIVKLLISYGAKK